MKVLVVEDKRGGWYEKGKEFKVLEMEDIAEWVIGETISKAQMDEILRRHGTNTVKVRIKAPKK